MKRWPGDVDFEGLLVRVDVENAKVRSWNAGAGFSCFKSEVVVGIVGHSIAQKQIIWTHLSILMKIINCQLLTSVLLKTTSGALGHIRRPDAIWKCAIEAIVKVWTFFTRSKKVLRQLNQILTLVVRNRFLNADVFVSNSVNVLGGGFLLRWFFSLRLGSTSSSWNGQNKAKYNYNDV